MRTCFCGCGRTVPRFPLGFRAINGRARQVDERVAWAESLGITAAESYDDPDAVRIWLWSGHKLQALFLEVMHGERDPRSLDEAVVRQWQAYGRKLFRALRKAEHQQDVRLGGAAIAAGLTVEEAAAAFSRALDEGMDVDAAIEALGRGELR